jgi:hypothetical protein
VLVRGPWPQTILKKYIRGVTLYDITNKKKKKKMVKGKVVPVL